MNYEELKREISSRSISQLPGLLQHVTRLCSIKPVFKDKESAMRFVERAWDMGGVGEAELRKEPPFEPKGLKFYSQSRKQKMMLISDGPHKDWLAYQHPDGQWVSLRKATNADRAEIDNAIVSAHHADL